MSSYKVITFTSRLKPTHSVGFFCDYFDGGLVISAAMRDDAQ
jgi:hypothetical protein